MNKHKYSVPLMSGRSKISNRGPGYNDMLSSPESDKEFDMMTDFDRRQKELADYIREHDRITAAIAIGRPMSELDEIDERRRRREQDQATTKVPDQS